MKQQSGELEYLPPYSPDLNEIEHYWFPIKNRVRKSQGTIEDFRSSSRYIYSFSFLTYTSSAITQVTVATQASDLIEPTIQALANEDVLVVATTGGQPIDNLNLKAIPANVRIESFIPHAHLLPYVDVMVTNGGFNGVQIALANSVPMVTAGQTEEELEICARVQWTGTGVDLKTSTPTPAQIRDAVKTILSTPTYKQNAQRFQKEISSYDSPTIATALLETLATTKPPVLRK